jgi:23S rRNA pseudouridine2457 synthase
VKELIYVAIYKPYDVLSQFTKETENHKTLADLGLELPKDVYPVGRLDRDSEGLLLLTNDKTMNDKLLNPKFGHSRTYYAQVEGIPTAKSLELIKKGGIKIQDYQTLPADAKFITSPKLPERFPPIRLRKSIPDSWISITLTEGKNRQVRKMCASVGNPCLRLVRYSIENLSLDYLNNKMIKYMTKTEIDDLLFSVRK